jgi:hypothetical protein
MSFYKKYELDRLIADGEAKTFRAVENSTGRAVFLHLFNPSGQPMLAVLKSKLGGDTGRPVPPLIEVGEFAGNPYAVTEAIEPFHNLREWISANVTASNPLLKEDSSPSLALPEETALPQSAPPPPSNQLLTDGPGEFARSHVPPPAAAPPVSDASDEFGRMFEIPKKERTPVSPAPAGLVAEVPGEFTSLFQPPQQRSTPSPPPAPRPPAGGLVAEAPGEFTSLLLPPQQRSTPSPPPPAASLVTEEPGEFTSLFHPPQQRSTAAPPPAPVAEKPGEFTNPLQLSPQRTPSAPAPPGNPRPALWPPPAPEASAETGQFTRLFGSRLPGEAIDIEKEHANASLATPPENRPFQAAGEFTRMFGPEGAKGPSTPAGPEPPPFDHTSTRLSSASGMFGDSEYLAKIAAEALSGGQPADSAPGEYTRFFDAPKQQAQGPSQPTAPAAPLPEAVPAKKSHRDLVMIVAAVVVLVALIVVVIVLRK